VTKKEDVAVAAVAAPAAAAPAPAAAKVVRKASGAAPATAAAPAPVAAAPVAAAPAAVPEAKATKKATKAEAAVPAAAAVPAVVAAVAVEGEAAEVEEEKIETKVKALTARLVKMREELSELISESKRLEKAAAKVQKVADKRRRRKAPVEGEEGKPARVSFFQVPTGISPQLCAFLGRPAGSLESRSNVTKFITGYVKEHNLMNKRDINADAKLLTLLGLKEGDKLTYFNLQKYLNTHYLKATPATA
jgi:chromatin remodeling complex protein RSC6